MNGQKQTLLAAIASTVAAAIRGINCVVDVALPIYGSLPRDAALTIVWAVCAACWWVRWSRGRQMWAQASPRKGEGAA